MENLLTSFFNRYELKAIVSPGIISVMPLLTNIIIWFPNNINLGSGLFMIILLVFYIYLFSLIARDRGKKIEKKLFSVKGNVYPTTQVLRHSDNTLNIKTKERYHTFLKQNVPNLNIPSPKNEQEKPFGYFDKEYSSAIDWLIKNKRDDYLTNQHNIEYGFSRNLLGMKYYGIIISFSSIFLSILLFITHKESIIAQLYLSTLINLFFLFFWFLKVNKKQTKIAAKRYALSLLSNCDFKD